MFGTLRYDDRSGSRGTVDNSDGITVQFRSAQATAGFFPPHLACESCRAKKLRCDGKRPSCERCRASRSTCQYTPERRRRSHVPAATDGISTSVAKNARITKGNRASRKGSSDCYDANKMPKDTNVDPHMASSEGAREVDCAPTGSQDEATHTPETFSSTSAAADSGQDETVLLQPLLSMFDKDHLNFSNHIGDDVDDMVISDVNFADFELTHGDVPYLTPELSCSGGDNTAPSPMIQDTSNKSSSNLGQDWDELSSIVFPLQTEREVDKSRSQSFASAGASSHTTDSTPTHCNCLQRVAHLLNNVTETASEKSHFTFDASLAYLKRTLHQCSAFLDCTPCISRSEFCMILILTMEKIVLVSEKETTRLISKFHACNDTDISDALHGEIPCNFGSYSLSLSEHLLVSRTLVALHLDACRKFLSRLRGIPHISQRDSQVHSLFALEARVGRLIESLSQLGLSKAK